MQISGKKVCVTCVGENYLKECIFNSGKIDICSYCSEKNNVVSLEWLSESVHESIQEHFHLTSNEPSAYEYALLNDKEIDYDWYREGQSVNDLLQDIVEIEEELANDIQEYLSDVYTDFDDVAAGEEAPYDDEAYYAESPAEQYAAIESWNTLCTEIKSRARFFSPVTEKLLDELFGDLNSFKAFDGSPIVQTISPDSDKSTLYRARTVQSEGDIEKILMSPVSELGAPPTKHARSGRMNPVGISVFYGAADTATCIAEVRPPVGSYVVLGKFNIIREIRLLDMDALTKLHMKGSFFNPESGIHWGRAAFLRQIVDELTKPVMPRDEIFEYLPTQAIAEYLSEKINPRLDGIIFHSSQISGEGKNVVLFNHASLTELYTLPDNSKVSVNFGWATDDDYDDSISVWEEIPELLDNGEPNKTLNPSPFSIDIKEHLSEGLNVKRAPNYDEREVTLKLDIDNVEVHKVQGLSYDVNQRITNRYKSKVPSKKNTSID